MCHYNNTFLMYLTHRLPLIISYKHTSDHQFIFVNVLQQNMLSYVHFSIYRLLFIVRNK